MGDEVMSRIMIKKDESQETFLVDYWISAKGNLCWKHNGNVYVKLKAGYTMMTPENLSNWVPADTHTRAKAREIEAVTGPRETALIQFV